MMVLSQSTIFHQRPLVLVSLQQFCGQALAEFIITIMSLFSSTLYTELAK